MSVYPSKRDGWLMLLLLALTGFFIYTAFTVHQAPAAPRMQVFATLYFSFLSLLMIGLCILPFHTSYTLDSHHLSIRLGPYRKVIPLADIIEAYPSRNPLSAPAWSLDRVRLRLRTSRFGALISPQDKHAFLTELAARAPHLQLVGDRVVRIED